MLEMVKRKKMPLKAASLVLKVNLRQGKRIYAAYRAGGDGALIHGNAGKKSNNRIDMARRERVLKTYEEKYGDFGPTLAAETLA